jgi:Protein of unknown function (DUF3093)
VSACHPDRVSSEQHGPKPYRETLLPSWWLWTAVLAVAATVGLVFLPALGAVVALTTSGAAMAGGAAGLLLTSARIEVVGGRLRAGRASIEVEHLGRVKALAPDRVRALRGREADARAYLCQRSWIAGGVVVEITDPQDPTPYWLLSSNSPQRLVAALDQARGDALRARSGARAEPPPAD